MKTYNSNNRNTFSIRVILTTCLLIIGLLANSYAQVSVTATAGTAGPTPYTTLGAAFAAINAGTHQGAITVEISASTSEGAVSAFLNASGAGTALYTSVLVRPTADGVIVSGLGTVSNRSLVILNGADNVTIDGDNPNTGGINRNLTFKNTNLGTLTGTAAIRLGSTVAPGLGADNNTIKNCIIAGNTDATTSLTGTVATTHGIFTGLAANTSAIAVPISLPAATTGAGPYTNLIVQNNLFTNAHTAIFIGGNAATVCPGLQILNNTIGSAVVANRIISTGVNVSGSTSGLISGNTIFDIISSVGTSTVGSHPCGIALRTVCTSVTITNNIIRNIQNLSTGGFTTIGINLAVGNSHIVTNNMVSGVKQVQAASNSTTFGAMSIKLTIGTGHIIRHNSVNIDGPTLGGTSAGLSACLAIASTAVTGCTIQNNIFNQAITGTIALSNIVGIFYPGTVLSTTVNNNAYYCNLAAANTGIAMNSATATFYTAANFVAGATVPATNLRAFTSTLGNVLNDNASFAQVALAPYTSSTDLHIPTATSTQLESGGTSVGITTDIDGDVRPGPAGSINGGAINADIGADEFDGVPPPANDISATAFILPLNGGFIGAGVPFSPQASFSNSGLAAQTGVTVRYKIIDAGLVEVYNQTAIIASIAPATTVGVTFPSGTIATPGTYTIQIIAENVGDAVPGNDSKTGTVTAIAPLCGTYNVGTAQPAPFNTLSGAIAHLNVAGISCAVTFLLDDATYTTPANTFPIVINSISGSSAVNTFTLSVNTGNNANVTASVTTGTTSILNIFSSNVIIDGSNNGSSSRNLTITQSGATTPRAMLIASIGAAARTNVTVKNCIIVGGTTASTINVSDDLFAGGLFNNITIENNDIRRGFNAMFVNALPLAGNGSILIKNNLMNATGAMANRTRGIALNNCDGAIITGNDIGNFETTIAEQKRGIWIGGGSPGAKNCIIENNFVHDIRYTGTLGFCGQGLIASVGPNSNTTFRNNMVYNISGDGFNYLTTGGTTNPIGIYGFGAGLGGYNIYNNTVFMSGNTLNQLNALSAGIQLDDGTNGNIKNNIVVNNLGRLASVGLGAAGVVAELSSAQFTSIDYNNYFCNSATLNGTYPALNAPGVIGTTAFLTVPALAAASGGDANSTGENVDFVSATNLHLVPTSVANTVFDGTGTPVAGVLFDIDGDSRHATTPDKGADEFTAATLATPPSCPTARIPADLSVFSACNNGVSGITLSWTAGNLGGANVGYNLYFGTTSPAPAVAGNPQTGTSYFTGPLLSNQQYFWRVEPVNGFGANTSCAEFTFTTGAGVSVAENGACYCVPIYTSTTNNFAACPVASGCTDNDGIGNFTFNAVSFNSGCECTAAYSFTSSPQVPLTQGGVFGLSVTAGTGIGTTLWGDGINVWIDFNDNGSFTDAGELIFTALSPGASPNAVNGSISIPCNAPQGVHRLRVRSNFNSTAFDACGTLTFGETEDYLVNIGPAVAVVATVGTATASTPVACLNQPVQFCLSSVTGTITWQYSFFSGGPFNDMLNTNNQCQNLFGILAGTFFIRAKVTSSGCGVATTQVFSNEVPITINNLIPFDTPCNTGCGSNVVSCGVNGPFSNVGTTIDLGEVQAPNINCQVQNGWCAGTSGLVSNSVWFTFTLPANTNGGIRVLVTRPAGTTGTSDFQVALWDPGAGGSCFSYAGWTLVAANDDAGVIQTVPASGGIVGSSTLNAYLNILPNTLLAGRTYFMQVDGFGTATGPFVIAIECFPGVPPVITCPSDAMICLSGESIGTPTVVFSQNAVTLTNNAPAVFPLGVPTLVTWTATDGYGLTGTCSHTVTRNAAPVIVSLQSAALNGGVASSFPTPPSFLDIPGFTEALSCDKVVNYTVNITGTPDPFEAVGGVTYSFSGATLGSGNGTGSGSAFGRLIPTGRTTVTVNATNVCGSQNKTFRVTIADNVAPVITPIQVAPSNTNGGECASLVQVTQPDLSNGGLFDNCPNSSLIFVSRSDGRSQFEPYFAGTTTVTWQATDASANTSTATQDVVVNNFKPVINSFTSSSNLIFVNQTATFTVDFTDEDGGGTHTVKYYRDKNDAVPANTKVVGPNCTQLCNGTRNYIVVSDPILYTTSEVAEPKVEVLDGCNLAADQNPGVSTIMYLAVAVAGQQFTTGGGHFDMPAGGHPATYEGFNVSMGNVVKKATTGNSFKGQFEMNVHIPGLPDWRVHTDNGSNTDITWDYLTIGGCSLATFKGAVRINGATGYKVLVQQSDKDRNPATSNFIRVKVTTNGGLVVFDTQPGLTEALTSGNGGAAAIITALSGGAIKVQPSNTQNQACTSRIEGSTLEGETLQNLPNPFNGQTEIRFSVPADGKYTLKVYNYLGQEVSTLFDGEASGGSMHSVMFDGSHHQAGIYTYTLAGANVSETRRMNLVK